MASKSKAKPAKKAPPVEMTATVRPALPTHKPSARSVQATLLTLTGFSAALTGLALTVGPRLSWKAAKIMVGFDYLGVHGGALVMGGLVLIGIAMLMRKATQISATVAQAGEDTSLLESVAADVLQIGTLLESIESSIRDTRSELSDMRGAIVNAVGEAQQAPEPSHGLGSEDAIFRLAASLDKVGAKIEERLKAQFSDLNERIGQVEGSISETAKLIENQGVQAAPVAAQQPAPEPHQTSHYPAPAVQQLHQTPHYQEPALHQTAAQPRPDSLGVLDSLDDEGVPSPLPSAQPVNFNQASELSLSVPPEPAGRWDDQPGPMPSPGIDENPLMTDPEVRAALEDLGHPGHQA